MCSEKDEISNKLEIVKRPVEIALKDQSHELILSRKKNHLAPHAKSQGAAYII